MQTAVRPSPSEEQVLSRPGGRPVVLAPRPLVMGVLNLTPDSFSDGGLYLHVERAVDHGRRMFEAGADLLDLGAESTRPGGGVYGSGATAVPPGEELDRLLPVLERLRAELPLPVSVDTRKASVAREALAAGADLLNDISALGDPLMAEVAARAACPVVLMHSRGELGTMQRDIGFTDPVSEVRRELAEAVDRAVSAGIRRDSLILDPGIGFGKTARQNFLLLRRLDELRQLGRPILVGASRKSFIGAVTGTPASDRLAGSLAAVGWAARQRAAIVRVHDVAETTQFLRVWRAIEDAGEATMRESAS